MQSHESIPPDWITPDWITPDWIICTSSARARCKVNTSGCFRYTQSYDSERYSSSFYLTMIGEMNRLRLQSGHSISLLASSRVLNPNSSSYATNFFPVRLLSSKTVIRSLVTSRLRCTFG